MPRPPFKQLQHHHHSYSYSAIRNTNSSDFLNIIKTESSTVVDKYHPVQGLCLYTVTNKSTDINARKEFDHLH
jgi:hypothetical protein